MEWDMTIDDDGFNNDTRLESWSGQTLKTRHKRAGEDLLWLRLWLQLRVGAV
jgi:hypothetical protein